MERSSYWKHKDILEAWANGAEIEVKCLQSPWSDAISPGWSSARDYRIKQTPDTINWEHVSDKYKWMSRDSFGTARVYINKPCLHSTGWIPRGHATTCEPLNSYKQGTVGWKDSLVERPENVRVGCE